MFYKPGDPGTEFGLGPGIVERIDSDAFHDFLRSSGDVVALWNHDPPFLPGRRSAGTLKRSVDATGLRCVIDTPDTQLGNDMTTLAARGDICGSSFSFIADRFRRVEEGRIAVRIIEAATLVDGSFVTFPAHTGTTASAG